MKGSKDPGSVNQCGHSSITKLDNRTHKLDQQIRHRGAGPHWQGNVDNRERNPRSLNRSSVDSYHFYNRGYEDESSRGSYGWQAASSWKGNRGSNAWQGNRDSISWQGKKGNQGMAIPVFHNGDHLPSRAIRKTLPSVEPDTIPSITLEKQDILNVDNEGKCHDLFCALESTNPAKWGEVMLADSMDRRIKHNALCDSIKQSLDRQQAQFLQWEKEEEEKNTKISPLERILNIRLNLKDESLIPNRIVGPKSNSINSKFVKPKTYELPGNVNSEHALVGPAESVGVSHDSNLKETCDQSNPDTYRDPPIDPNADQHTPQVPMEDIDVVPELSLLVTNRERDYTVTAETKPAIKANM